MLFIYYTKSNALARPKAEIKSNKTMKQSSNAAQSMHTYDDGGSNDDDDTDGSDGDKIKGDDDDETRCEASKPQEIRGGVRGLSALSCGGNV